MKLFKQTITILLTLLTVSVNAKIGSNPVSEELKKSCEETFEILAKGYDFDSFIDFFYLREPNFLTNEGLELVDILQKPHTNKTLVKGVIDSYSKEFFIETVQFGKQIDLKDFGKRWHNPDKRFAKSGMKKVLKHLYLKKDSKALKLILEAIIQKSKDDEEHFFYYNNGKEVYKYSVMTLAYYYAINKEYSKSIEVLNGFIKKTEKGVAKFYQARGLVKLMNGQSKEAYIDFKWYLDKIGSFDYPEIIYEEINKVHKEIQKKKEEERILAIKKKNPYYGRQYELGSLFMRGRESVLEILQPTKVEKVSEVGPLVIYDYETEKGWYAIHYMDGRAIKITFLSRKVIPYNEELKKAKYTKYGIAMFDEPKEDDVTYKLGSLTHNFLTTYGKREFFNEGKSGFEQEVFIKIYRKRSDGFISKLPYVYKIEAKDGKVISATFKSKNSI